MTDLGLSADNSETGLFTIAARLLNPSGYRPCRLCGKEMNVGYFYINKNFTRKLKKDFSELSFHLTAPISEVIATISNSKHSDRLVGMFENYFPERTSIFREHGVTTVAFEKCNHIGTTKLSPGFMGNPPDRLDGFHDYCVACRKSNDPGRSDENMRTYNRDRRTFEWWAEGNWALADALYNSAGPGKCCFEGCTEMLEKVSPDHVGPLACGFKQLPLFVPSCPKHNSAKNRRFSYSDVQKLIAYEQTTGTSVASWQVRAHWDFYKNKITSDGDAKALSNSMRSLGNLPIFNGAQL